MPRNKRNKRKNAGWTDRGEALDMHNTRFEKYYKEQHIIAENEWDLFMEALRRPLPSTFRVAGHRETKHAINKAIKETYIPSLEKATFNDEPLPVPSAIPWYPDGLAWKLDVGRKELRKSADYKRFHQFLVYETEIGNISRQEAVSMLPPLFLNVRHHHSVIDLCASPGSKTSQILEAMDPPTGIIVANDADQKRAHLLVHNSSRLSSPALMVTNLDASVFPSIKYQGKSLRFDRVLADVPCSGDGTLRKNVGIWKTWTPMEGNGLHSLQLRILQRAMRLLANDESGKEKPRIVYSTCSLNPVENEAVVAAALNSVPDFELVDVSCDLPTLVRRPGIVNWRPAINRNVVMTYASYEEYKKAVLQGSDSAEAPAEEVSENMDIDTESHPKHSKNAKKKSGEGKKRPDSNQANTATTRGRLLETHWPPENVKDLCLDRCIRIYPHLQDTGGFFIAVLQRKDKSVDIRRDDAKRAHSADTSVDEHLSTKRPRLTDELTEKDHRDDSELIEETESSNKDANTHRDIQNGILSNSKANGTYKENPFTFVDPNEPNLIDCVESLQLSSSFPRSNAYVRNPTGEAIRTFYLVNDATKAVILQNDNTKIRLISAGVRLFGRSDFMIPRNTDRNNTSDKEAPDQPKKSQFRILSEGIPVILPYINRDTLIGCDESALRVLLEEYHPLCSGFNSAYRSKIESLSVGNHLLRIVPENCSEIGSRDHELILPLWKSEVSVSMMIDKKAKSALSLRLFGEDITVAGRQAAGQAKRLVSNAEAATNVNNVNHDDASDIEAEAEQGFSVTDQDVAE